MNIKITNHTMVLNLDYTPHVKDCYNDEFGNFWIIDSVKLINTIIPNKPGYSCFEIQFSTKHFPFSFLFLADDGD